MESVWDYPRPPRLERTVRRLQVIHAGVVIADSVSGLRVLETSHPPVYYIPPGDVAMQYLRRVPAKSSYCEFKGKATYWDVDVTGSVSTLPVTCGAPMLVKSAAWSYGRPTRAFAELRDHLAFYASRMSECWVDDQRVVAQEGDFYGGWITPEIRGPFKGAPGTMGW
jgi:uncharacterized protein (DUF427 family)